MKCLLSGAPEGERHEVNGVSAVVVSSVGFISDGVNGESNNPTRRVGSADSELENSSDPLWGSEKGAPTLTILPPYFSAGENPPALKSGRS